MPWGWCRGRLLCPGIHLTSNPALPYPPFPQATRTWALMS